MATEFQMPKLGLTMEAGTILQWLVDDGTEVTPGTAVMLIETDKVETEIEVSRAGVLHQTGLVGETYDCGAQVGWFLDPGELPPTPPPGGGAPLGGRAGVAAVGPSTGDAPAVSSPAPVERPASVGGRRAISPNARRLAEELGIDVATVVGTGPGGRIVAEDVNAAAAAPRRGPRGPGGRLLASPMARRLANDAGLDLAGVVGSGPGGRIVGADVRQAVAEASAATVQPAEVPPSRAASVPATFAARNLADLLGVDLADVPARAEDPRRTKDDVVAYVRRVLAGSADPATAPSPAGAPVLQTPTTVQPLSGMRGTIASRMHASLAEMAQLTLMMDADMSAVVADRERRRSSGDVVPGYTDYVIWAVSRALVDHPHVNSQITPDGVAHLPEVHVGMAVALDHGLMVPVVRNTPALDLAAVAAETSRLADAVRSGRAQLGDLEGGTFSVTALGMFGVDGFTPVVNPPNTAILGVGRLRDEVVWVDDAPGRRPALTLSLTWDHRAFDGAPAAAFAGAVVARLEGADHWSTA